MKCLPVWLALSLLPQAIFSEELARLPQTEPLQWTGDLSARMHEAALHDVDQLIAESQPARARFWHPDGASPEAYVQSLEPNRRLFADRIGLAEPRLAVSMERFGDELNPALVAEAPLYRAEQVRWEVLAGVHGEGLLLTPKGATQGFVVALPDADQTPEQLAGLAPGLAPAVQTARRLAESGFTVVVPVLIDRRTTGSGNPAIVMTNQPHREWIHRQAYMMGRHLIGYEVQKVLGAIDWCEQQAAGLSAAEPLQQGGNKSYSARPPAVPIGVAGYGEGGLLAFYAAAVDPRIKAALVSGYFKSRQETWSEPLYRNVWGLLREYGDAEIAALIAPRGLVVQYAAEPRVDGPPPPTGAQRNCAAPGRLQTPPFSEVQKEFGRIAALVPREFQQRTLVESDDQAFTAFAEMLGQRPPIDSEPPAPVLDLRRSFDPGVRQMRQLHELEAHIQNLVSASSQVRNDFFLYKLLPQYRAEPWSRAARVQPLPAGPFITAAREYRRTFWEEILGKLDQPLPPMNARSRQIYDRPLWTGYEVVLDVGQEGFAWGILCLPKNLQPGERRPVVVCQHGRHGVPKDVIEGDLPAYHDFAARLAEQGFITFAPHNLYQKEDSYRTLSRKANTVHASMFSFILRHHEQILNWLCTLPNVDAERIGFYGLSYGGETAVRVPPLLDRYCLSICSGDFNDWTRKVASTDDRHSFMFTDEWEMPYFKMGNTFSYAELTYLLFPRPFMVERGHHDGVAPDEWVAAEFAKTRWLYAQFGLGDRSQIEFFNGGHTIHGQGTFEFLHQQLHWPPRTKEGARD